MKKLYAFACALLCSMALFAQFNTNTSVNLEVAGVNTADIQTITTSTGKTWIAFYQNNSGNYDMRAQLLDVDGTKLLGPDGMLVGNQTSGSATYVFNVCLDAADNLVIAYQYQVSGTNNAVVTKVTQAGTLPWGAAGIVLGPGLSPYPGLLSSGAIVVAWSHGTLNTLSMQKITPAGTFAWAANVDVKVGTSNTTRGQVIGMLNDNFTLFIQRRGTGINTTPFIQRYNSEGVAVWAAPVQLSTAATAGTRYYSLKSENDTTYVGFYASPSSRFNSILHRVNPDGTLVYGATGIAFDPATASTDPYQQTTNIVAPAGSPYVWMVCSMSNSAQSQYGVFVQKFAKSDGARQLGTSAKPVYAISANLDRQEGNLGAAGDGVLFMHYDVNYKIYATRLDASGNFVWPTNKVELSSTTATQAVPKGRFGFTAFGNNQAVAVWAENRGTELRAYAQNITSAGQVGPLPVQFTSFGGKRNGNLINLYWTTASEASNTGFYIEKSADGSRFSTISFVPTKANNGNSAGSLEYGVNDIAPFSGNNYYRLKQVDKDGKTTYTAVVLVRMLKSGELVVSSLAPNPAFGNISLVADAGRNSQLTLQIVDINGKLLVQQNLAVTEGRNVIPVPAAQLVAGTYLVKITSANGEMSVQRFVKQ